MRGFKLMGLPHSQVVLSANRTPLLPSTQRALRSVYHQPHRQSPKGVTRVDSRQSRLVNTYAAVFTNVHSTCPCAGGAFGCGFLLSRSMRSRYLRLPVSTGLMVSVRRTHLFFQ